MFKSESVSCSILSSETLLILGSESESESELSRVGWGPSKVLACALHVVRPAAGSVEVCLWGCWGPYDVLACALHVVRPAAGSVEVCLSGCWGPSEVLACALHVVCLSKHIVRSVEGWSVIRI